MQAQPWGIRWGQATLTLQQVHLQPLDRELGRVEAVGGCDVIPGRLATDVVQDAALPCPVQPQHQHLPPVQLWGHRGGTGWVGADPRTRSPVLGRLVEG